MASVSHPSALNLLKCSPTPLFSPDPAPFIFFFPERSCQIFPVSLRKTTHNHSSVSVTAKAKGETKEELIDQPTEDSVRLSNSGSPTNSSRLNDSNSLGIKEPVFEVIEVRSDGIMSRKKIHRRQLLKSSGLRLRDIRSVDPSLWLTNSAPSLLVRDQAILLNLGSLHAIVMHERVLIFDYHRRGGKDFLELLMPRINPKNYNGGSCMPFELEVVEAALLSRIQRYEQRLMEVEPRVVALLEVLPNRLTADILEQLRISKQTLVELGSRVGALRQMLLDLLEDTDEIRHICIIGRNCTLVKGNDVECAVPLEKQIAEEEEEEIEMLLENYLQRCESCHGQAERLLDSAKEMEDSIAVNLSSRRLEVSRVELLLQVGTFCVAVGALVAGIFGMNLKSYLEQQAYAFWLTTGGIVAGGVIAFFILYFYLRNRRIL
ncbi:hypothetical protein H6P81_003783 [Aristolochia fimbriata]|uniref:Magnesium transporter n=1 Tax=Aristolochia fimbriata TaxID=158543 RepID=A0AAV7FDK7_ARIFI|nr:hypothetical protein H6P81_003783 [Aristolochia fimbriata]